MNISSKNLPNVEIQFNWKNSLKAEEIGLIINQMIKYKTFIQREVLVGVCLIKLCTDIDLTEFDKFEKQADIEIYNYYTDNGIIPLLKENITNYDLIEKGYKEETSLNKIVDNFLNSVNKKIPNNMEQIISQTLEKINGDINK